MTRIEKLVIDGYRGIDVFEYEPNMINIFVGRNNTGKSTILEATAIVSTASAGFKDKLGNNILEEIIETRYWTNLNYFINLKRLDRTCRVSCLTNEMEISVKMVLMERLKSLEELPQEVFNLVQNYYAKDPIAELVLDKYQKKYPSKEYERMFKVVIIEAMTNDLIESREPLLLGKISPHDNWFVTLTYKEKIISDAKGPSDVIFAGHFLWEVLHLDKLYGKLLSTGNLYQTLDYLRKHIPYFRDIRSDKNELWISFEYLQQPIPLTMAGDGMREFIRLLFVTSLIPGGVLLLEEPENNLHPGLHYLLAERLVEAAQQDKTQIFLSTHNLEFAENLLRSGGDLVNVVRLYQVKDEIAYEVLSHREALEELDELHIDLRGP